PVILRSGSSLAPAFRFATLNGFAFFGRSLRCGLLTALDVPDGRRRDRSIPSPSEHEFYCAGRLGASEVDAVPREQTDCHTQITLARVHDAIRRPSATQNLSRRP